MATETANDTSRFSEDPALASSSARGAQDGGNKPEASGAQGTEGEVGTGNDSDAASSVDHVQDAKAAAAGRTKREKVKAHCGRFWWMYLIALIVILAIMLPLLFTVIIPKIVQNIVNGQKLPIYGGVIRAVTPDKIEFSLETSLDTPLPAVIDDLPLNLYNKETKDYTPFIRLTLPKIDVSGKTDSKVDKQMVKVDDHKELVKWFNGVFDDEEVEVQVRGDPKVHLGELNYSPSLDKTVKLKALNYLKGFTVTSLSFMMPPNDKGYNVKGNLNIPNAGVLTLSLGNVSFNLLSGDVNLGLVHLYNLDLKPGDNTPTFEGEFYFKELVPNLSEILESQATALQSGNLHLAAKGNTTIVNGEHIKYIEEVLNNKHIEFDVSVISLLASVLGGVLDSDGASLYDLVGDVFGNSTLLENALDHFNISVPDGNEKREQGQKKRFAPGSSLVRNMMRLSLRNHKKHKLH